MDHCFSDLKAVIKHFFQRSPFRGWCLGQDSKDVPVYGTVPLYKRKIIVKMHIDKPLIIDLCGQSFLL